jgi:hypothetical protein
VAPPLYSTLSAVTELFVTAAVYVFLVHAYQGRALHRGLIAFALTYEVLFNVSYMTFRFLAPAKGVEHSAAMSWFLAGHGLLSLVMLIGLIGLVLATLRQHRLGLNYLANNPGLTWTFAVLWGISIASGEAIYVLTYL